MAEKNTAVFGIYSNLEQAESAVDQLLSAGFSNSDVSVLVSDSDTTRDFAHRKATKAPEGTATGAAAGGLLGGTLGLLAGIEHFSFSYIPLKHSLNHAWALAGEI
ncbi:MAG TPA: general stress protein [Terracidiphilus sp.]|nr:general stress protein [Terracidiphilus sp.]